MEMANRGPEQRQLAGGPRLATMDDAGAIQRLLRESVFTHVHVDWHMPGDWLGTPGFAVFARPEARGRAADRLLLRRPAELSSCLAIAAEPLPSAWVRVAALDRADGFDELAAMFDYLEREMAGDTIDELSWFVTEDWPEGWFLSLGFSHVNDVISYRKGELDVPSLPAVPGLSIRPVSLADLPELAAIEADAFEPRWRHSAEGLRLALAQTMSFDVAELEGRLVGFQFSTRGRYGAHLARMTIHPSVQGRGIGKCVLAAAIEGYRRLGLGFVTLNTPADNAVSQRLYTSFGFQQTGPSFPVLARPWPLSGAS